MKKKLSKKIVSSGLLMVTLIAMTGCGVNENNTSASNYVGIVKAEDKNEEESFVEKDSAVGDSSETVTDEITEDNMEKDSVAEVSMVDLPEGITGVKAENIPNKQLKNLIIEYFDIPEEYYETTKYYYNYVDLNEDGSDEIFVVVSGPYTSGTGGSSALWVVENAGKLHVNQDFTLVNIPIIVSDTITDGVHDLVVPYYGGGAESQYSILKCNNGEYTKVADGGKVKTLEGITGKAIIANDLITEIEAGFMGLNLLDE